MIQTGYRAAIAADSHMTAQAGAQVAACGGNAVDIAVAAALAATVSEILMCSLGGSGFFMVRMKGKEPELIEGADVTPAIDHLPEIGSEAWHRVHIPYGDGVDVMAGPASIAVPGVLAAAEKTWERHGSLPWKEIVSPAIALASRKIPVSPMLGGWLSISGKPLFWRNQASRAAFFDGDRPLETGDNFQVAGLQQALEAIADEGADAFYRGDIGRRFAADVREHGGFVTREALAAYRPRVRKPLSMRSCGFELALNPPPAVGGAAVGFLVRSLDLAKRGESSPAAEISSQAEAQLRLLRARKHESVVSEAPHDPEASRFLEMVNSGGRGPLQAPSTTHVSVATADGDMIGITMSMGYGSGFMIRDIGIPCNGSLGEPELNPNGFLQLDEGKRITSNMSPTVAWHADGRFLVLGSPGASRISTAIAQTWKRVVLDGMSYEDAVAAPRIHIEQYGQEIRAQFEPAIDTSQLGAPFVLRPFDDLDRYFGGIKLIGLDGQGRLHAVADSRREGAVELIK